MKRPARIQRILLALLFWFVPQAALIPSPSWAEQGCATGECDGETSQDVTALEQELRDAEANFAAAFFAGDMTAFAGFLDENAVFMGRSTPLRGKQAIVERWTRMRGTGDAPFQWRPERVAVEADGLLGLSTGPVLDLQGVWLSSFASTWRRTPEGWRVVLDVGPRCPPAQASEP